MSPTSGSGTTYIFSNYLSTVSPAWGTKVGTGRSLHWPADYAGAGNAGVASAISCQGTNGYASAAPDAGGRPSRP
jgi:phosphate transport system substrate-binding protein